MRARPAARRRRDPARALVLRGEPVRRGRAAAARVPAALPAGAPPPFSFGSWIGGDIDGNPEVGRRDGPGRARAGARDRCSAATAATCASSLIALASSRSLVGVSDELEESIARDERECAGYRDDAASDDVDRARTGGSSRTCGGGSRTTATPRRRSCSADIAVIRRSLEENRGDAAGRGARSRALARRVELFGFHVAKLDVRLHASEVRSPTERTRGVFEAVAAVRARHGSRALDTVIVSATTSAEDVARGARPDGRAGRRRAALRDDRRPRRAPPTRCGRCSPTPRYGARVAERGGPARGDGRLLRLRQGRRLPRGAVGDLPRPGGARGGRARGAGSSSRSSTAAAGAPGAAAARSTPRSSARRRAQPPGPPEADRAGRDDLAQVRPARDRLPEPRGGARRRPCSAPSPSASAASPARASGSCSDACRDAPSERTARSSGRRHGFVDFFRAFTPVDELALLALGSRPPRRPEGARLPGGAAGDPVGLRLDAEPDAPARLVRLRQRLRRRRPRRAAPALRASCRSSRSLVDNLEMTLAKSSLEVAREYLELVPPELDPEALLRRGSRAEHARHRRRRCSRPSARSACSSAAPSSAARSGSGTPTSTR